MRPFFLRSIGLLALLHPLSLLSQGGSVDASFAIGDGADDLVMAIAPLSNGKILIGGFFTEYDNAPVGSLARLNADGTLDNTFGGGAGFNNAVQAIAVQPDGKILVGGLFSEYDGTAKPGLVRLMSNGAIDGTFSSPAVLGGISTLALQSNGRILVGGSGVAVVNGFTANIVRLNANGSLDSGFDVDPGPNGTVLSSAVQADGRVMAGGFFSAYHGTQPMYLARVETTGSKDAGFLGGTGTSAAVRSIVIQPDGKIVIAGSFTMYNGNTSTRIARLLTTGALDGGFTATSGANSIVHALALQADGKVLLGGLFTTYGGVSCNRVARLLANGNLDPGYDAGTGANDMVRAIAVQSDGKVLLGGGFSSFDGLARGRIVRLNAVSPAVQVAAKVLLDGPFVSGTGLMNDALRSAGVVPNTEPYTGLGYNHVGGGGGEAMNASVLAVQGNNAIVDWVFLELRNSADMQQVLATRSVLVQRDGDVVDVDGTAPVSFAAAAGNYAVAVKHRNHLAVMTAGPIALGGTATTIDFTLSGTATFGSGARKTVGAKQVLWAGDVTGNNRVSYTGVGNDRDPILSAIGGTVPTQVISGTYARTDANMDGLVKYTGTYNDRDVVLLSIGGAVPTAVRLGQLP
ncbi:MAG: delta-60 repeat domain-containing protein [Flavobacteriales bacterium]